MAAMAAARSTIFSRFEPKLEIVELRCKVGREPPEVRSLLPYSPALSQSIWAHKFGEPRLLSVATQVDMRGVRSKSLKFALGHPSGGRTGRQTGEKEGE